jgi:hypothetical protein
MEEARYQPDADALRPALRALPVQCDGNHLPRRRIRQRHPWRSRMRPRNQYKGNEILK